MPDAALGGSAAGQVIAGKYRVLRLLGTGGMGYVVAAEHLQLRNVVAIKLLSSEGRVRPESVARFLREARAAVRLRSEHVVRVLDLGTLDNGVPYIVMEQLEGIDFEQLIEKCGPMPAREVAECIVQACEALAEAHAMGIVHRDLKPSNLFLTKRPDGKSFVKVLDFGISKIAEDVEGSGITSTSDVLGTPAYVAPEQIKSAKLTDTRTDIWALGLILAECISGRPVYRGSTKIGVLAKIAADPVPDLGLDQVETPPGLAHVIGTCLEKNPANRFQTVAELASALSPFVGPGSLASIDRIERALRQPKVGPAYKRVAWIAAGLVVAGVVGIYSVHSLRGASTTPAPRPSSAPPPIPEQPPVRLERPDEQAAREATTNAATAKSAGEEATSPRKSKGTAGSRAGPPRTVRVPALGPSPDGLEDRK